MVSSSEGMFDGVHGNTSHLWPAVTFDLVLVVSTASLQHWLVDTTTTGYYTDGSSAARVKHLLGTGWKLNSGLSGIEIVGDDDGGVTGCLCNSATITIL